MKNRKIAAFIFTFCTLLFYSQINNFKHKIDFNLLTDIAKISDDSIRVSNVINGFKTDKFYYYSKNKKIIPYGYEIAFPFIEKTAIVKYDGLWGLINRDGTFIYYSETPFKVKLSSYEKFGIFDEKGIFNLRSGARMEGYIGCAEPSTPDYFINKTKNNKFQLNKRETGESIYKQEFDTIISQNFLMYENTGEQNLLLLKKGNKYGVYLSNGTEIQKIKYSKAKFIGKYIALNDGKQWTYSIFENNMLKNIISSDIECLTPTYQNNVIGVFKESNKKYNLLKVDGSKLSKEFDYIDSEGTYGIDGNTVYIFTSKGDFYEFYQL